MTRYLRWILRLVLAVEAWTWSRWCMVAAPPEHEGAHAGWSPAADFAAADPPDWDNASREADADAAFWLTWNNEMDRIENMVRDGAHTIETMALVFLTDAHPDEAATIGMALVGA